MISIVFALSLMLLSSSSSYAQPHPVGGAAFVSVHDRLYVQGGDLGGSNLVSQFYSLDLSRSWQTNSPAWNSLPSGPINAYHSGGFSADMNSFITFGRETGSPYTTANFINIFSTSTGSWIGTGSTMIADTTRRDMAIASDPNPGGQIYFMGGDAGNSGASHSNSLDVYNLKSSIVSETNVPTPGPQNLQGGAASWLPNRNSMLVVGGLSDNPESNVVYLYTPKAEPRYNPSSSAAYLTSPSTSTSSSPNGSSHGVNSGNNNGNSNSYTDTTTNTNNGNSNGNSYTDTTTNTNNGNGNSFKDTTTTNTNNGYGSAQNNGYGSSQNNGSPTSPTSGSTAQGSASSGENAWTVQNTNGYFPSSRSGHCVASNEDGSMVAVFGGFANRSSISDHSVYFLDTRTWTWTMSTSNAVRGRSYSACAFTGNQFVVWGGFYQNPTSTPNNLPSVEDSTIVYSLDQQNWVNSFVPSATSYGSNVNDSQNGGGNSPNTSSSNNIGFYLAIAAAGAILAFLITLGAVLVIRKRNQKRRTSPPNSGNSHRASFSSHGGQISANSSTSNTNKRTLIGAWDQKTLTHLENGLLGAGDVTAKKEEISMVTEDIPPVSAYNNWERRGSTQGEVMSKTMTTSNGLMGITQTTIVSVPNSTSQQRQQPQTTFNASNHDNPQHISQQQHQPQTLEDVDVFETKSNSTYYPISIERGYR